MADLVRLLQRITEYLVDGFGKANEIMSQELVEKLLNSRGLNVSRRVV